MFRTLLLGTAASVALVAAAPAFAQDWKQDLPVFRIGLLGGENEADRLRNNECLIESLGSRLGVPVELFPAPDYAGVMQGLLADQLEMSFLGASGYAGIYLQDPEAVEPIFTNAEADGSLGYKSVMVVRADSDIQSLEDMQGRTLAYADPNSTSGYLVPRFELGQQGIADDYFAATGFGGGHEQGIVAVLNGQYDGGVTWVSGVGEPSEGYTRGNLRRMIDNGLLDMADLRVIWESNLIPNGPIVLRKDVPAEVREIIVEYFGNQREIDSECYVDVSFGDGAGWKPVDHAFYEGVVTMRKAEMEGSR